MYSSKDFKIAPDFAGLGFPGKHPISLAEGLRRYGWPDRIACLVGGHSDWVGLGSLVPLWELCRRSETSADSNIQLLPGDCTQVYALPDVWCGMPIWKRNCQVGFTLNLRSKSYGIFI